MRTVRYDALQVCDIYRKFSTEAKARAFVESEGGEAEFVRKFSRGWA